MNHFQYKGNELHAEEVSLKEIVARVGSPVYVYSHATLTRHFTAFDEAFAGVPHTICYSVKANSTQAVLRTFITLGGGADIVSGGELYRALQAGVDPKKVVYSGVGKKDDEIEYALNTGILMFNVESEQELTRISEIASRMGKKAGIAIRVNPDVDPQTHPYITTGLKNAKFGITIDRAMAEYARAKTLPGIDVIGIDMHIGSQLTKVTPFVDSIEKLKTMIANLRGQGIDLQYFDCGGGLGIQYSTEEPPLPADYGKEIVAATKELGMHLLFEPGRNIVGNAGILVATCLFTKERDEKNFIMIDAGMNDLARPALYGSFHGVQPVVKDQDGMIVADIVGPICESGDFLVKDREVPMFRQGDLMAFMSAGAYGFAMSSTYNSRPRVAEVMVKGNQFEVVRERETVEDLIRGERVPSFL
ncbi:diaminopimelate decarboxylase [Geobacter sulfurreducens]|jgi:diaminopimelate decarboxylase|uniref:Diaminopimelate decarboxylase n=1 Tax=Geobacter sulfurreducens (strain ATCC 51573 / DSM 12127 / PCA) TaxID=243231 RepID=Q74GT7_GEOSL|nr:diaminopimelate decarboxylase [Geobacter sulfurreducens]BET60000.1 diaminopimelate decarboxylase [Geobacter sp. 60473]AAR33493.1 diaminopimelate decarboxylase [Geobacter sulfurreducens PCA]ADI82997.1 diaminopimelate decarboxylase [Geobacter sulfurreducens KN400]AJY69894.1 diaminopimelate decarboxylase [Geobacter sulfurreducens]QVW35436.1 diaminopimelate decarboxylase [Geobacter sulfurreducens]